ncbi:hypothetical protein [Pelagerythrobacter sp.]
MRGTEAKRSRSCVWWVSF